VRISSPIYKRLASGAAQTSAIGRRLAMLGSILTAVVLGGAASVPAASAATAPRIDLKVLLLGTSTTEPDFQAWEAALQREGVAFNTLVESSATASGTGYTPIAMSACAAGTTCQTLSDTASDGTLEAKYDAIIVATGDLSICPTTTCGSALASSDWSVIEQYEHEFNIRQITGDVYPGSGYGLNTPTASGALDGSTAGTTQVSGTLTADGQTVFPYLKATAPITMDTGTYGYEATPVSPAAAATSFDTLVSGPGGSALVGIYTDSGGVQSIVETFNENQYQLQAELLRHGAIAWATRGVYFGTQANYLETNIDDNFLSDDSWSVNGNATTAAHSTDYNPADALREPASDIVTAANWSKANNLRIDMLFNGGGSVAVANGDSLVGSGDGGSGTTGTSSTSGGTATGTDPLLAQFTATDSSTGKPYTDDFGWISHTWDHPNIDEGCATQDYIEAELNQNTTWGTTAAAGGNPTSGGLGLTLSTDPTAALGTDNPNVIITGEHSGLANLLPGNPGQVDPPGLDDATQATTTGATLPAGEYVYAISDQFNTAAPGATAVAGSGESAASVSSPVTVSAPNDSVTLTWSAVCHAADYKIYRAPYTASGTSGTIGAWSLITTVAANTGTDFTNPTGTSTTNTTGGGAIVKTYTDTGAAGTPTNTNGNPGTTGVPSSVGTADESAYEQNPVLDAAFAATQSGGIKYFGADASKPYPNPADGTFTTGTAPTTQYTAGQTFTDAGATAIPRYPTNIYYNVATNAQETDEYETLYDLPSTGTSGRCTNIPNVTTCNPAGTTFTIGQIVASIDQGMFAHMMGNDPRPSYFHQTNLMSQATGVTADSSGCTSLFCETLDPLLTQYNTYFASNAPIEQPTMAQIGTLLTEQSAWNAITTAASPSVSGYIQGNQVTITNTGTTAVEVPVTGDPTVGSSYGGTQSGWTSIPAGTSTYTSSTTWPVDTLAVSLTPSTIGANSTSTSTATVTVTTGDGNPIAGDANTITFASTDAGENVSTVTSNGNGTYTATITSSTTVGTPTITATDTSVAPVASGQATLTQIVDPAATVDVSLSPSSIAANGTSTSTATATATDASGHPVSGDAVSFSSSDSAEKIGTVTKNPDGTYTATITSSTTVGTPTITATDISVSPAVSGNATLTQSAPGQSAPGQSAPGQSAPGQSAPGQSAPGQSAPGHPTRPSKLVAPTITGAPIVGQTLSASAGTWSGSSPITYRYQWQRCNPGCSAISEATGPVYKLVNADRGARLRVTVTASNRAGSTEASSPQAAAAITASTATQIRSLLARLAAPSGSNARIRALLSNGGYPLSLSAPVAGRVGVGWYPTGKAVHAASTSLATVTISVSANRRTNIKVALTRRGRQLMTKAGSQMRLSGSATFMLGGTGTPIGTSRTFTVTR